MPDACSISIPFSTQVLTVTDVEQTLDAHGVHSERVSMQFLPPQSPPVIRGMRSNMVVIDDVADLDPELAREVVEGFSNPAPQFFDISTVRSPADRTAFRQPIMP